MFYSELPSKCTLKYIYNILTNFILLIQKIRPESMKYYRRRRKGQKEPPGPDHIRLTGSNGGSQRVR
jgi:hypothetical protein